MNLHPKIQALRNNVGSSPIRQFFPRPDAVIPEQVRTPKVGATENDREIEQYFAVFNIPDSYGTMPVRGCFKKSIKDNGPKSQSNYKIPVCWQHDIKDPLCLPSTLEEDEYGLRGVYTPDPIPSGDRCVIQVRSKTINQGSYGFNYLWDKMEYDETLDVIKMYEVDLIEVSPVTRASQKETFCRNADGIAIDEFLIEETEDFLKQIPRKYHNELRALIDRHITLAKAQPHETRQIALDNGKPQQVGLDYNYLISKLK